MLRKWSLILSLKSQWLKGEEYDPIIKESLNLNKKKQKKQAELCSSPLRMYSENASNSVDFVNMHFCMDAKVNSPSPGRPVSPSWPPPAGPAGH